MNLINGTSVTVLRPRREIDRLGNEVDAKWEEESVDNVLVVPGATARHGGIQADGVTVAFTLHFPKEYTESLEGCSVKLPVPWDGTFVVIGDPRPYMNSNVPGPWNRPVEVEASHG